MIRRSLNILTATSLIFFLGAIAIFVVPWFFDPEFKIVNTISTAISVTAAWRSNEKSNGSIKAKSTYRFSVDDETAMQFRVRYEDGREFETRPLYFTSGIWVVAEISDDIVAVRYQTD